MTDGGAQLELFRGQFERAGLAPWADALLDVVRPGARLVADPAMETSDRASRLGGLPDLSPSITWPTRDGRPLSFIAQVNLADVTLHHAQGLMPERGMLSFFYDALTQDAWGFSPADRGSAAVLYTPAASVTQRRHPPIGLTRDGVFEEIGLRPEPELSLAPGESYVVSTLGMPGTAGTAYAELLGDQDGVTHRLLGHPDPIQGDMQEECQLVTNGLYCGDATGYNDPTARKLRPGAAQWRLLLQVDSQEDIGMMWGDAGRLYYWIRESDLADGNWGETWLILQCG